MVEAMEIPKGFKKTEVGVIPNDWEVANLIDLSNMKSGESITSRSISETDHYPCYGGNGKRGFTTKYTHDGDYALIGRQGALCGNVQFVSGRFFASEHAVVVTPKVNTDIKWLYYVLANMNLNQYSESSAQPGLSVAKILNLPVSHPTTKTEQTAIATALNDADALITELEKFIAKKKAIKQGAMQELLKPKEGWEVKKFGDLFELNPSKTPLKEEMVIFLGMEDVSEEGKIKNQHFLAISQIKKGLTFFKKKDVLVAKITPCFENGKGACLDTLKTEYGFGSTEFHVLRTNEKSISKFIFYHTQTRQFRKQLESEMTGTAGQKRVPAKSIANYYISVPPIEIQNHIAQILSDMDTEIEALEKKLDKYKMLKQGMMQNLLTGRIRLI